MDLAWGTIPIKHTHWSGWNLWFDGAVRKGNSAAGGIVLKDPAGKMVLQVGFALEGRFTCNKAEYSTLIRGLQEAAATGVKTLQVHEDSKIVRYQVLKRFSVKAHNLVWSMSKSWN